MTWTMTDRHAFVEHLPRLEPPADPSDALRFVDERGDSALAEVGAQPGIDQVRAGLVRALHLLGHPRLQEARDSALAALRAFPDQVRDAPPTLLQRRHPAWVGLATLECGRPVDEAIELARAGFQTFAGPQGDGEILWAMAEAAEDVGWTGRHRELLQLAATADFLDPEPRDQVHLLLGLQAVADGDADALQRLDRLVDDADVGPRTRVHAAWVAAALCRDRGDGALARSRLELALELVDGDEEPAVVERLLAAIEGLPTPAES